MLPQATETRGHSKGWSKVMLNLQAVAHADRSFTLIACLLEMFLQVASHESGRGCDAEPAVWKLAALLGEFGLLAHGPGGRKCPIQVREAACRLCHGAVNEGPIHSAPIKQSRSA